jgi:hypothetical protein
MADLLSKLDAIDGYRAACAACPVNAAARRGQSYTLFSLDAAQQQKVADAANQIEMMSNVLVVPLDPSADGGFPHTRPLDCVCIQPRVIQGDLLNTLIHESIHIHQRRNPTLWQTTCRHEGWSPVSEIPQRWKERCRINPDTMSQPFWAWQDHHVPLPMFRSSQPQGLGDVDVMWWDRRMGTLFKEPPRSFQERYGASPAQPEHPFELLAVELSDKGILEEKDLMSHL